MTEPREMLTTLIADVVSEHFERLRADVFVKMLELRTPRFSITAKGELYCDGALVGDIRPVFQDAVAQALKDAQPEGDDT